LILVLTVIIVILLKHFTLKSFYLTFLMSILTQSVIFIST